MANKDVFCNTPWFEAHIYWDGSLGVCCQESRKLYSNDLNKKYNINNMSLSEWINSDPVNAFRESLLSGNRTDICSVCYKDEKCGDTSRRHKANHKSVIFTKEAFNESYQQSPHFNKFEYSNNNNGKTLTLPLDLHIDLGNYCNLACKMCYPGASTRIASQYVRWGIADSSQYLKTDWTKDADVWNRVLEEIVNIPNLSNIHFMGGETLLTNRFEQAIDYLIANNKTDIGISFVTNGTVLNLELIKKLNIFKRCGIEISIETTTKHNDYIRQGSNVNSILKNIEQYAKLQNDKISLTIRSAISALSIGNYYTLLEYCLTYKLIIKNLIVTNPIYMSCSVLPDNVKSLYLERYTDLISQVNNIDISKSYNESHPDNVMQSIKLQVTNVMALLTNNRPDHADYSLKELVQWCKKWDNAYKFDALQLYPELAEAFKKNGY